MNFFDKIGKKANETYKITADKTNKLAKEAKLKLKMSENKSKINEIYEEIGKKVYENHRIAEKVDVAELIKDDCKKIDDLSEEIENILTEIRGLKDKKQCPNCHTEIDINVKFCPTCGAEQNVVTKEAEDSVASKADQETKTEEIVEILENSDASENAKEVKIEKIEEVDQ